MGIIKGILGHIKNKDKLHINTAILPIPGENQLFTPNLSFSLKIKNSAAQTLTSLLSLPSNPGFPRRKEEKRDQSLDDSAVAAAAAAGSQARPGKS